MNAQLELLGKRLEDARAWVHRLARQTPAERWSVRSRSDSWSVAECVEHLNITSEKFLPPLRKRVETAPPAHGSVRYRRDVMGWFISFGAGPLPRLGRARMFKVKTTPTFVPGSDLERETIVARFDSLQDETIAIVRAADGKAIHKVKVASPFLPSISYSLYSALVTLERHQVRHLQQADRVWSGG